MRPPSLVRSGGITKLSQKGEWNKPFVMFEEFFGKPLKIEPHDPETFTQQFRLGDEGRSQVKRIVERSILVYGEKSTIPDFVRSAFEKQEKTEKVNPFLRCLKKFNEECATWYQFTLRQHPMPHRGVADESWSHETSNDPRTSQKQSSNPKERKRIGEKKRPCWACGNIHGGEGKLICL
jgi:hypothetical protein